MWRTVLSIVMNKRIGAGNLIFLSHDAPTAKRGRSATNADVRQPDACVGNPVAVRGEVAGDHRATEIREDRKYVGDGLVELSVGQCGDGRGDGCVLLRNGAIRAVDASEDGWAGVCKSMTESLTAHGAGGAFQDAGDVGWSAHRERELQEGTVDEFDGAPPPSGGHRLDDGELRSVGRISRGVAGGVQVRHHAL